MITESSTATEHLNNPENAVTILEKLVHNGGRRSGDTNIPRELQVVIGAAAQLSTSKEVAESFDISHSQVHQLKHNRTTSKNGKNTDLEVKKRAILDRVKDETIAKIILSLEKIDDESMEGTSPRNAASIAKDLAVIHEKLTPKVETAANNNQIQVVIYNPGEARLEDYSTIEVSERRDG